MGCCFFFFHFKKISIETGLFMFFCPVCFPGECVQGTVAHAVISALGKKKEVQGQPELGNKVNLPPFYLL